MDGIIVRSMRALLVLGQLFLSSAFSFYLLFLPSAARFVMQAVETDCGQVRHIGNFQQAFEASSWDGLKRPGMEQVGTRWFWCSRAGISTFHPVL